MSAHRYVDRLDRIETAVFTGEVRRILPTSIEADGPNVPLGTLCAVESAHGELLAEVVQIDRRSAILVPLEGGGETFSGARVTAVGRRREVPVGDRFLGRAVDALGRPIDGGKAIDAQDRRRLVPRTTSPLDRTSPTSVLETGIRAIDGFLTIGHGQRIGIFAAAGVGKTKLMTQLARQVDADICVACLVGERGREIEAFWSRELPEESRARSVLVAATSDQNAAMRVRASDYALALASHWRAKGKHVLLLLDSVTRLAMAMREIGLAAGEPPTVRAYTPGVFAAIPKLVEQCGALRSGGSITAVMTVLSETDDLDDPISEMMKSLLDGHILLSRELAEQGHYPAIDIPASISRQAAGLVGTEDRSVADRLAGLLGRHETARTLIETGVYQPGSDPDIDRAIAKRPALLDFLRQPETVTTTIGESRARLARLAENP